MAAPRRCPAWLVALLLARPSASARIEFAGLGPNDVPLEGVAHTTLKRLDSWAAKPKLLSGVPGDLFVILRRNGLAEEYSTLVQQLSTAGRGRLGNWKASAVYRTMYVGGHEAAFQAKGVSIFLSKREGASKVGSTLKLFFVDRSIQPAYVPPDVYSDAKSVVVDTPRALRTTLAMPDGVFATAFRSNEAIKADKTTLPVDVLKLLEAKGALLLHMDIAAKARVAGGGWFQAAVELHRERAALAAKGLGIFLCYSTGGVRSRTPSTWLEYVDLDATPGYVPEFAYPAEKLDAHEACERGDSFDWYRLAASDSMARLERRFEHCGSIAIGAISRNRPLTKFSCKCRGYDEALFCGGQQVGDRKWVGEEMVQDPRCGASVKEYCWNLGGTDDFGHDCFWYNGLQLLDMCGKADTPEFRASERCCGCGGGLRNQPATKENVAYCAPLKCLPRDA